MEDRIRELFSVVLSTPVGSITEETRPATLEAWDSLRHLILISSFEEEFEIDIDPEEIVDMYEDFGAFKRVVLSKIPAEH